ncbi:MAG: hypothetical protein LBS45_08125 [Synergistaceae bacterium]|jgi:hypothetical protein|nr:hypothetical protein [Synergistaceae bacterium]
MRIKKIVRKFWSDINARRWDNLAGYFSKGARINWPNTGESFDAEGFRSVKSRRPGYWYVEVEKIIRAGKLAVSIVKVSNNATSFHVASFFKFKSRKILSLFEYWGEDGKLMNKSDESKTGEFDPDPIQDAVSEGDEAHETNQANQNHQAHKAHKANKEASIAEMPKSVKKSAWTRLFFPDDAV